ncbi:MAG: class I SAM-dependent methyltransferase [Chloroflexi bacterium]|uniref:class I SAM-dependent methyltransferase n=1 Tax=Candidatus Flexifilum breve TaxID=3140694 RepID=UPI0031355FFD|nr:class I SAM-dependent methyltransferase [Chloroflexota bacterium]
MSPQPKAEILRANWWQRQFARALAAENASRRPEYERRKRALLGDLSGTVLEIGPGPATNLTYYAPDVRWIGLEPNPAMFPYIEEAAQQLGRAVELHPGHAEDIPLGDASVDAVVGTLVLCSVDDPAQVLREVRRVLKPGGRYVFIEHVAAPRQSLLRRVQAIIRPVWKAVGDGCTLNRETWATIEQAGFSEVQIEHFRLPVPIYSPHIAGAAVK